MNDLFREFEDNSGEVLVRIEAAPEAGEAVQAARHMQPPAAFYLSLPSGVASHKQELA